MEQKLISKGYKVWEANGKKRIYINNIDKFIDLQSDDKTCIINGMNYSGANLWKQRRIDSKLQGNKVYYDCVEKEFHYTTQNEFEQDIMQNIVDKIKKFLNE